MVLKRRAFVALSLGAAASCAFEGTGGEAVEIRWAMVPVAGASEPFAVGEWTVQLEDARIALGPVYAFAPPTFAVSDLFGVSRAYAHGGDDNSDGQRVLAEVLDQKVLDLLSSERISLDATIAEAGQIESLNVVLDEPRGDELIREVGMAHALVRGVATRGEDQFRFTASLATTIPDTPLSRRVDGLPVNAEIREGSEIELRLDPRGWLRGAQLDPLFEQAQASESAMDEVRVGEPSQFHNAWYLNLRDPSNWRASVSSSGT